MEKILELCGEFISGANVESLTFNNIKERLKNLEEPEISAFLEDKSQWKAIKPEITKLLQNHISSPRPESPSVQGEVKEEHFEATPQKKRKNSKTRENECPPKKIIENPAVTKKEDLIKKYKMYVHKCGVRKIWKKELDGLSENQQLTKVKSILEDLGMEGRPSLSKCEAIKEKIEYEKEMQAIDTSNIIETSRRTPQQQQSSQRLIFKSDSEEDEDKLDLSKIGDPEDSN